MSATYVVGGRVSVRPESFDKNVTITDVDTLGKTEPIALRYPSGKVLTVLVMQTAGPSTLFKVELFDDPTCTDEYKVFEVLAQDTPVTRMHVSADNAPFNNTTEALLPNLYVKVTPTTGSGHTFFVRIQADVSKIIA